MDERVGVSIREAAEADLPAMEWEGEYRRFRRVYRHAMAEARQGRYRILIAESGSRIVGQVLVRVGAAPGKVGDAEGVGFLHALRVRPNFRNEGLGTRLIEEAEAVLRQAGCRRAAIAAAKSNPAARRLYERLGYTVMAEDSGEWSYVDDEGRLRHVSEPAHILEKEL